MRKSRFPTKTVIGVAAFAAGLAGTLMLRRQLAASGVVAEPPRPRAGVDAGDKVEVASDDSFPASDPPAFSGTTVGSRRGAENYQN
jgi:hypothetical protein